MSYDVRAAYQCRDRRAEAVDEKEAANYCEYFEMIRREFVAKEDAFGEVTGIKGAGSTEEIFWGLAALRESRRKQNLRRRTFGQ